MKRVNKSQQIAALLILLVVAVAIVIALAFIINNRSPIDEILSDTTGNIATFDSMKTQTYVTQTAVANSRMATETVLAAD